MPHTDKQSCFGKNYDRTEYAMSIVKFVEPRQLGRSNWLLAYYTKLMPANLREWISIVMTFKSVSYARNSQYVAYHPIKYVQRKRMIFVGRNGFPDTKAQCEAHKQYVIQCHWGSTPRDELWNKIASLDTIMLSRGRLRPIWDLLKPDRGLSLR